MGITKGRKAKKGSSKQKKPSKKLAVIKRATPGVMAIIPYSEIAAPVTYKGSLSLIKTFFEEKTIRFITRPTPKQHISTRKGPDGQTFKYVDGHYAKKCANFAFGFSHSFEITSKEIIGLSAIVLGRLIIRDPKTGRELLHKDDIGSHTIRFFKGKSNTPENAVDIGNDFKSAATDCLKRTMVQVGFFSDVYGSNEAKQDGFIITGDDEGSGEMAARKPIVTTEVVNNRKNLNDLENIFEKEGLKGKVERISFLNRKLGFGITSLDEIDEKLAKQIVFGYLQFKNRK